MSLRHRARPLPSLSLGHIPYIPVAAARKNIPVLFKLPDGHSPLGVRRLNVGCIRRERCGILHVGLKLPDGHSCCGGRRLALVAPFVNVAGIFHVGLSPRAEPLFHTSPTRSGIGLRSNIQTTATVPINATIVPTVNAVA